jgi:hypothetical protein
MFNFRLFLYLILSCLAASSVRADSYSFSLLPADGTVTGTAGSTAGWGYSISNLSSTDWLVTTAMNSDPFVNGTPNLLFDFPDIAPSTTVTLPFSQLSGEGLFEVTWDSKAPVGSSNLGTFRLSAQWWTGDPLNGGAFFADAPDSSQTYLATVIAGTSTPETGTVPYFSLGSHFLAYSRKMHFIDLMGANSNRPNLTSEPAHVSQRERCWLGAS